MPFLKNCRVSFKRPPSENAPEASHYSPSVILEDRICDSALLFESGVIAQLTPDDLSARSMFYTKVADAFACLGVFTPSLPPSLEPHTSGILSYLVLATGCVLLAKFSDHEVYRITSVQFVSLLTCNTDEDCCPDLRKLLSSGFFFYGRSTSGNAPYDLTMNIQNRHVIRDSMSVNNPYLRPNCDLDFLWNGGLMCPFLQWGVNPLSWIVPIVCGSFESCTVYFGANQVRIGLFSRVSSRRPGTRFNVRGVDDRGYVANFVETEQFICVGNTVSSHVQLRGTVPLFWEQPGLQVGSHKIQLTRQLRASTLAFERHLTHILSRYGSTAIVNLIGCKQGEALLTQAFQEIHRQSSFKNSVSQIVFDYHSEMQAHGPKCLDWLQKQLDRFIQPWGYFRAVDGNVEQRQEGALRVNCVDCLDRTNAVQTLVGIQLVLPKMLFGLSGLLKVEQLQVNRFIDSLRQLWQQNGDQVSRIYAGTGAIGGGRSRFRDVQRSAARAIQQSLFDGAKHSAMYLLLSPSNVQGWLKSVTGRYLPRRFDCLPPALLTNIMARHEEFIETHDLRVFVGTWNVNGGKHYRSVAHKNESVSDWLLRLHKTVKSDGTWGYMDAACDDQQMTRAIDVFAVGFEEIVDLTTSNIVAGSKPTVNQRDWGHFLLQHLNRGSNSNDPYILVGSVQLVGVCLFVFIRSRLAAFLREFLTASVKTGLGGAAGNKGSVAIRFQLGSSSVCFVCSHFTAGQSAVRERNDDFHDICRRLNFANGLNILNHDFVFWCGDFNYRINLSGSEVKRLSAQFMWSELVRMDQLTLERQSRNVFQGFDEGPIRFAPTYKYDLFCDDYDTSEKARSPAWTDRVLWRHMQLRFPYVDDNGLLVTPSVTIDPRQHRPKRCRLVIYNRCELKTSDHRPVAAIFDIGIHSILMDARRRVTLDTIQKYGPMEPTVQLTITLTEAISQLPVALSTVPINLLRRTDFIKMIKSVGSLNHSSPLLIRFLSSDTLYLTYANSRQAFAAATLLNGHVIPLANPVGLSLIDGGYQLHLHTCLKDIPQLINHQSVNNPETPIWQDFIDVAEREDASDLEPYINSMAFESPSPDSGEFVDAGEVETYMNLEHRISGSKLSNESDSTDEDLNAEPPRIPPPRPAPPIRPPAPNIGETHFFVMVEDWKENVTVNDESTGSIVNRPLNTSRSTTGSPVPSTNLGSTKVSDFLTYAPSSGKQTVTSCLDLFAIGSELSSLDNSTLDRSVSSTELTKLEESSCLDPVRPLRPPPPPPRLAPSSSTLSRKDQCEPDGYYLSTDDPFSLVSAPSELVVNALVTDVDPNAPLIRLSASGQTRQAPPPPPRLSREIKQSNLP